MNRILLMEEEREALRALIRTSIEGRSQALIYTLARRIYQDLLLSPVLGVHQPGPVAGEAWFRIESLSQLRARVGGRFQNLKGKWVGAGFPLREHRGDRREGAVVDPDGWEQLAAWIGAQGFEARLAPEGELWFFEVRLMQSDGQ